MTCDSSDADREAAPRPQDIERSTFAYGAEIHRDPRILNVLYHECGLSQRDIARECGVTQQCIQQWMDRFDLETRPPDSEKDPSITKSHKKSGKTQYHVPDGQGDRSRFYRHQLIALLCEDGDGDWAYTPDEVFNNHVHHEAPTPGPSLDIPENLAVVTVSEHVQAHISDYPSTSHAEETLGEIFDGYDGEPPLQPIETIPTEESNTSEQPAD